MNPLKKKLIYKGKVHSFIENEMIVSKNGGLYIYNPQNTTLKVVLKRNWINTILNLGSLNLFERLFRKGIHHCVKLSDDCFHVFVDKKNIRVTNNEITSTSLTRGSRPLSLINFQHKLYYGEYRSNNERSGIHLFELNETNKWISKIEFTGIRHIHGFYEDPYSDYFWMTTGDEDSESKIFQIRKNDFEVTEFLYGSQQTRAIKILFDSDYIYFGSDAPEEINHIYRVNKKTKTIDKLTSVGSSVFHGCKVKNWFFFSTAIEPSIVNKTKYAEIWASPDGVNWKCILTMKKDFLDMKYFQYGQITFPDFNDSESLLFTTFGLKDNCKTYSVSIKDIESQFKFES